jgi:hypothetical protein
VPLDSRYEHTVLFDSLEAQIEYFTSKRARTLTDYSYIRKTWELKVSAEFENARTWNYLFFRNSDTSKYYFYFINQIEYENNGMVKLSLELDVLQTYMFDFSLSPCFIERAHTSSDEVGEHTVSEGLETGDLINRATEDLTELNDLCILVYSTFDPNTKDPDNDKKHLPWRASLYDNIFAGMGIFAVAPHDAFRFGEKLEEFSESGEIEGIINVFMYPRKLVQLGEVSSTQKYTWDDGHVCKLVQSVKPFGKNISKQTELGSYTPRNKKLLTYPYNVLYVSNNAGTSATYKYERFSRDNCEFSFIGCYSPDGSVKLVPQNYDGIASNHEEGFSLGTFPSCAWNGDMYKLWLAQNQNTQAVNAGATALTITSGIAAVVGGVVLKNPTMAIGGATAVGGGFMQAFSMMAADQDKSIQPNQSLGTHSVSVNVANNKQTFSFYKKTVTEERAKILDDFFTRYGYKIMRVQEPNLKARPHFTYIKTIGAHVIGEFCNEDRLKLESIFDTGVTLWRNASEVCDFSVDNSPS